MTASLLPSRGSVAGHPRPHAEHGPNGRAGAPGASRREQITVREALMGGEVSVHLELHDGGPSSPAQQAAARRDATMTIRRMAAWATRLTRFSDSSDLSALNRDSRSGLVVRPTLAAVLAWGRDAGDMTDGVVDITLLDERVAAETAFAAEAGGVSESGASESEARQVSLAGSPDDSRDHAPRWTIGPGPRGRMLRRSAGLRFDIDGVAKGWLADRALARLRGYRVAVVDADGDIAIRIAPDATLTVAVGHPFAPLDAVAHLRLDGRVAGRAGVATSGTTVHRWGRGSRATHHLIDPWSQRPAVTDVVQATVIATSAREAEAWAKTAVILGSHEALRRFDTLSVGLVLVTDRNELLATTRTLHWLQ